MDNRAVAVEHYENFPVASWLCPSALRPAVKAIYWFARTADDIADEGGANRDERLAALAAYRADLLAVAAGRAPSTRWSIVFASLAPAIATHDLPIGLLLDLLSAFEQDVTRQRYDDRAELLDYCRRSANPVGRLLLHLYGVADAGSLRRSDEICTALQLANFWQDLGVDAANGRLYVPAADMQRHGVVPGALLALQDSAEVRALVADEVAWARGLMDRGAPLATTLPGRAGWELRLVVQGGLRVLERIEQIGFATLTARPALGRRDAPALLWRAIKMRPRSRGTAVEVA